jgi:hypothetical protein
MDKKQTAPRLIAWPVMFIGTLVELFAFDLGSRLMDATPPWNNLRHFPVLLTMVGLGVWLARRDPRRWSLAVLIHVPVIFVAVTLIYEVIERAESGRPGVLDGSADAWGGILLGAVFMAIGALIAAWLEPGARERRAAARTLNKDASAHS